ncbi:carbohydrate kinase family protein [Pacificibacter marinus]|uniref:2-dehydro-3-deoxygluconokinase n=1 Tax=Pacificibacter marinus TaxID=658057 RepID=A0A1Y5SKC5_9RHOB|nr:carbohydrate kinase [Pacificibacter marinus]SEK58314.1 fructokinase [Pacificibacter marinus]SLN42856.1 2-dehydro-3-deoxygluconokinase [Pacificibacter marinus]
MILCAGEALIDMLPRESTLGEDAYAPHAGGAVFNTAIALGRLGAGPAFYSGLSNDFFGELLKSKLAESGVDASLVVTKDRPCTVAFVKLVDGHATYAFYDENTAGRMLTPADLPVLPDTIEALFFGGISLPVEPCGEVYEALCAREAATRVIMMDPNIRPSFIKDEARYRARMDHMLSLCDIVKVSDEDLLWIMGDGDIEQHIQTLLTQGPSLVCLTEGSEGVRGFTKNGIVQVAATKVDVADTVGAGDTFNAGLLASLQDSGKLTKAALKDLDDDTLRAALAMGSKAASITVSRAGANPPWAHEM